MDKVHFNDGEEAKEADWNDLQHLGEKTLQDILYALWDSPTSGFIDGGFLVTQDSGMVIQMALGRGFFYDAAETDPDQAKFKPMTSAATRSITVPTADATNPRKDIVCVSPARLLGSAEDRLFMDETTSEITTESLNKRDRESYGYSYVTGTPAGSPAEPSVPSGYVKVATIAVAAGATSIANAQITDQRSALPVIEAPTTPDLGIAPNWGNWTGDRDKTISDLYTDMGGVDFRSTTGLQPAMVALDSTRVLILYYDSTAAKPYGVIATVGASAVTYGTPVDLSTPIPVTATYFKVAKIGTDKVMAAYYDSGVYAVVLTVSGNSISYGTAVSVGASNGGAPWSLCALDTDKVIISRFDSAASLQKVVVVSASGATVSVGTAATTADTNSVSSLQCVVASSTTSFIWAYIKSQDGYIYTAAGTVSGTTITLGTPVETGGGVSGWDGVPALVAFSSTKGMAVWSRGALYDIRSYEINVSGTTVTIPSGAVPVLKGLMALTALPVTSTSAVLIGIDNYDSYSGIGKLQLTVGLFTVDTPQNAATPAATMMLNTGLSWLHNPPNGSLPMVALGASTLLAMYAGRHNTGTYPKLRLIQL